MSFAYARTQNGEIAPVKGVFSPSSVGAAASVATRDLQHRPADENTSKSRKIGFSTPESQVVEDQFSSFPRARRLQRRICGVGSGKILPKWLTLKRFVR